MSLYDNWYEEQRSAYLYGVMAHYEPNFLNKKLFNDLKEAALKQSLLWAAKIKSENLSFSLVYKPNTRTRIVIWLVRLLGTSNMRPVLSSMKIRGMSVFAKYHSEHKHTSLNSISNLRAAIFGINDGLISNMSLILGIAGANASPHFILLAGCAGLLAGACSMAAGEYISVRTQLEVFEYQIAIEKQELAEYPDEEAEELSLIYQARGIPKEDSNRLSQFMVQNPEIGLDALAREELGLNPDDLVSPIGAMLSSFISFTIGAFIPLTPFLFSNSSWNLWTSITLTGFSLFIIGAVLSLFTTRHPVWLGLRMLGIGVIAGFLTYSIGKWLGTAL